ncbi:MAG: S8 family serine peptidase, partial [Pirellulaceae bacterium]|nr:S8 family serine peptidase [Pirellulaceae bacterium]
MRRSILTRRSGDGRARHRQPGRRRRLFSESLEPRCLLTAGGVLPGDDAPPADTVLTSRSWLVDFGDAVAMPSLDQVHQQQGCLVTDLRPNPILGHHAVVDYHSPVTLQEAARAVGLLGTDVDRLTAMLPKTFANRGEPNDPLFPDQWHLKNVGQSGGLPGADANVVGVWDSYLGDGVVIAIVDDGLQYTHPDLKGRYRPDLSYDYVGGDPDPQPEFLGDPRLENSHGTAVAGVAAATGNNSLGVTGVAQRAELAGLRLTGAAFTGEQAAGALTHCLQRSAACGDIIDVYNSSWGPPDVASIRYGQASQLELAAVQLGAELGRDGKGAIYVWAGGNGGALADNVNYDLFANSRFTIAVGAIDHRGNQSVYSEPGAALLVSAYSSDGIGVGITTTDLIGYPGLSMTAYTYDFGGTSSAAPLVSGVVALMLEANPDLTWRDVQYILADTARRTDPSDSDWQLNGGSHWVNHKYGFGAVDAAAAVDAAERHENLTAEVTANASAQNLNLPIPDGQAAGVSSSVEIAENLVIENVSVRVNITHANRGDLRIVLTSPQGTRSVLADYHEHCDALDLPSRIICRSVDNGRDYANYTFTSQRHRDELSAGSWKLEVIDGSSGRTGTLRDVELTIHGHQPPAGFDRQGPVIESLSPAPNSDTASRDGQLRLTFDEEVQAGTGDLVIRRKSSGLLVERIPATSSHVAIAGATVVVDPSVTLEKRGEYYVEVDAGAFEDLRGNPFRGLTGRDAWSFEVLPLLRIVPVVEFLSEDADVSARRKVADLVVDDPTDSTPARFLTGTHAAAFELLGDSMYLRAGADLDYELHPQLFVTANVGELPVGSHVADSELFVLELINVNDVAPTLILSNVVQVISDRVDNQDPIPVATIDVQDDGGSYQLSITGPDAPLFELNDSRLFLKAGTVLDATVDSELQVAISVDDPEIGSTPDDSVQLTIRVAAGERTLFFDDFETGELNQPPWLVSTTSIHSNVRVDSSPDVACCDLGEHHLVLDHSSQVSRLGSYAEAAFPVDLSGHFHVKLSFDYRVLDTLFDPVDVLALSWEEDVWHDVFQFDPRTSYTTAIVDVSAHITRLIEEGHTDVVSQGVMHVRFGNRGKLTTTGGTGPNLGLALDNVHVTGTPIIGQSKPDFADQQFAVDEGLARDAVVGTLVATDPEDHEIEFQILDGNRAGVFAIDGDRLVVARPSLLRHRLDDSHQLVIRATDNGTPPLSRDATVTILVADRGLSEIVFQEDFESLPAGGWNGGEVTRFHAPIHGAQHLVLSRGVMPQLTTATIEINAAAFSDLALAFYQKELGSEYDDQVASDPESHVVTDPNGDGVLFSVDGEHWYVAYHLTRESSAAEPQRHLLSLQDHLADVGLESASRLLVRFSRFGRGEDRRTGRESGMTFDDILVVGTPLPVVPLHISPDQTVTADKPIEFLFHFQEAVTGFTADDITVNNGTKGQFASSSGQSYSLLVNPLQDGQVTVSVAADVTTGVLSANGNLAATASVLSVTPEIMLSRIAVTVDEPWSDDVLDGQSVDVRLSVQPPGPVTLSLLSSDTTETIVFPSVLAFSPSDWDQPKSVTIAGVPDQVDDGDQSSTITVHVEPSQSDALYHGVYNSIAVTSIDVDESQIAVSRSALELLEGGQTQIGVGLTARPDSPVELSVVSTLPAELAATPARLLFTPDDWDAGQRIQMVNVAAPTDGLVDGDRRVDVTVSVVDADSNDAFDPALDRAVEVIVRDIDAAGISVTQSDGGTVVGETGTTDSITVMPTAQPSSNVVLSVVSGDTGEVTVAPALLTFTPGNWNQPQTVTVTGVDDPAADGNQVTIVTISVVAASSDDAFDGLADQTVSVTTIDDDSPGISVTQSDGGTVVGETGTTDSITVMLTAQPSSDVVLSVVSGYTGEVTVAPATLTFTPGNWNQPQTVTVTGVDDPAADGNQVTIVTISVVARKSDEAGEGVDDRSGRVTKIDDDSPGVSVTQSDGGTVVGEAGITDSITVMLTAQPSSNVVLSVVSGDTGEVTVAPALLTFTPGNWN